MPTNNRYNSLDDCIEFCKMFFDNIFIGVIIGDCRGTIIYYNKAQEKIDGILTRDIVGRKMWDVYNYTAENSPSMNVCRTGVPAFETVNSYATRSGNLVNASCNIYPIKSPSGEIIGAICLSQTFVALDSHLQSVLNEINLSKDTESIEPQQITDTAHYSFSSIIGSNKLLLEAIDTALVASNNMISTMLVGETGVGKEVFAQSIHYNGPRKDYPYMAINCAAMPETLLEGLLFGTSKGAFTGALNKQGLFEASNKGTIFLDEVDSMPLGLQSKLLRAIQEKRVRRVGESQERKIDVRMISAVGREPNLLIQEGLIRPDFYYRLGVIQVSIPPLRKRMDDIPALVSYFLHKHSHITRGRKIKLSAEVLSLLNEHVWPGNVRELEHTIEASMAIMGEDKELGTAHILKANPYIIKTVKKEEPTPPTNAEIVSDFIDRLKKVDDIPSVSSNYTSKNESPEPVTLADKVNNTEIELIESALNTAAGKISLAAKLIGISPQLLNYKLKKYKLKAKNYTPKTI